MRVAGDFTVSDVKVLDPWIGLSALAHAIRLRLLCQPSYEG